jgi:hypothetical protein
MVQCSKPAQLLPDGSALFLFPFTSDTAVSIVVDTFDSAAVGAALHVDN